jgi:transposase, IS5 family
MHQTKKGNQWYFGRKAHLGVEAQSGLVHRVAGTAANVADIAPTHALLHGAEKAGLADAGYLGVEKRAEMAARSSGVAWQVAAKRGQIKALADEGAIQEHTPQLEKLKAQVRARVEHPFPIMKNLFRHRQARDRRGGGGESWGLVGGRAGLAKNTAQLPSLFALANLVIARRSLRTTAAA